MKSIAPFTETLASLMRMRDISGRELSRRIQALGHDRHHATLSRIYNGSSPLILIAEEEQGHNPENLEAIARALHVPPETFAEYRLWRARSRFNPKAVGWGTAIRNLEVVEAAEARRRDEAHPIDPADLLEEDRDNRPSRNDAA